MVFQLPWIHRWILLFTTADFLFPSADFALLIGGTGLLLAKVSSTDCWCSNIHLVKWRRDRKVLISKCALICDLHLLSLDKWPICRMFEINLMARHAPSGEAFVVALHSLPSIKKLLESTAAAENWQWRRLSFHSDWDGIYFGYGLVWWWWSGDLCGDKRQYYDGISVESTLLMWSRS